MTTAEAPTAPEPWALIICAGCGQEKLCRTREGKPATFCSAQCRRNGKLVSFVCAGCNETKQRYWTPAKAYPVWCSQACRSTHRTTRDVEITCVACGTVRIVRWRVRNPRPQFCSRECSRTSIPLGTANHKYGWTPEMDAMMREVWRTYGRGQKIPALQRDSRFAGIPKYMLWHHARTLGLAESKNAEWTPAEDGILEQHAGDLCVEQIARRLKAAGFTRTFGAVANRIAKKYNRGMGGQTYTAADVGRMLGWSATVVFDWIRAGKLYAVRQGTYYRIHPSEIASFVRREGELLGRRAVDVVTLAKILDEHRQDDRHDERKRKRASVAE